MHKITTCLWFDANAEEGMTFYQSVFKDSKVKQISRYPEEAPGPTGQVMVVSMEILDMDFILLNGGPNFKFNESVSFMIHCKDQSEVDYYWTSLLADGGEESMCGWLKDKFGVSWQVTPDRLLELMSDPDPEKSGHVMKAMLEMRKIDIQKLEDAYKGA